MQFLSLIAVLLIVQWWGSGKPLQRDNWFYRWSRWLDTYTSERDVLHCVLVVALPALLLLTVISLVSYFLSTSWVFFINIPVLLYSLGRGEFTAPLNQYLAATRAGDSVKAVYILNSLQQEAEQCYTSSASDWTTLHGEAFRLFCYRGFERMFAVLFWFMLSGASGALAYRLMALYRSYLREHNDARTAILARALAWAEWPATRLIGLTWALVGNFEQCMGRWRHYCLTLNQGSAIFLTAVLRGALGDEQGSDNSAQLPAPRIEPEYSRQLLQLSPAMFSRALLTWVFVAAVVTLII